MSQDEDESEVDEEENDDDDDEYGRSSARGGYAARGSSYDHAGGYSAPGSEMGPSYGAGTPAGSELHSESDVDQQKGDEDDNDDVPLSESDDN